jgi:ribosomal protein L29
MKFKELKAMSKEEIQGKLKELKMELIKGNAQVATGTVPKNPGQLRQTKKAIAKILQIMSAGTEAPKKEAAKPAKKEKPKTEEKKE